MHERSHRGTRIVQQQLGFDSVNAGRILQRLSDMVQQPLAEIGLRMGCREHIANHTLAALVNEK